MSNLTWALRYAEIGWPVAPKPRRSKRPLTPHGSHDATTDRETIERWWTRWPTANIAVSTRSLLLIDADLKHGGPEKWTELAQRYGVPETPTAVTGGGGLHIVFACPEFDCVGLICDKRLEVKTGHQLFTVAPSVHASGTRYRWTIPPRVDPAPMPPWLAEMVRRPDPPQRDERPSGNHDNRMERAARYAEKLDQAISGCRGAYTTMRAAVAIVRGFDLKEDEAMDVLSAWNLKNDPPWSERELRRKVRDAARQGRMEWGALL